MNISIEQFRQPSKRNIYLFYEHDTPVTIPASVARIAQELHYHLATIQGQHVRSRRDLLAALARGFNFPTYSGPQYERLSWDGASDLLGDLSWLSDTSDRVQGFMLLYLQPTPLIATAATDFALFLDIFSTESQRHIEDDTPFYLLLGPVDRRADIFIRTLRAADHIVYPSE